MYYIVFLILIACTQLPKSRQDIQYWKDKPLSKQLSPFTSDGCSLSPEGPVNYPHLWTDCCLQHDYAYWKGGNEEDRKKADLKLKQCIESKGTSFTHYLYYIGTRIGGSPELETSFKWGYGWKYQRGYIPLNDEEKDYIRSNGPNPSKSLEKHLIKSNN